MAWRYARNGFGRFVLTGQHRAPVVMGLGILRLQTQSQRVLADRLREVALGLIQRAQVAIGFGISRLDLQGAAVMHLRGRPLLVFLQHQRQGVMGLGVIVVQGDRLLQSGAGPLALVQGRIRHCLVVITLGVVRRDFNGPSIALDGSLHAPWS